MEKTITIRVNPAQINHTMAGGIGASWHAISHETIAPIDQYKWSIRNENPRGSAYGGNPPVENTTQWNQIYQLGEWLGLNWMRVELSARMYHPQKDRFDWDNVEMQALYKILDWCEAHEVDVFLQQMWSNVEWNSYPEVHPLLSAPRSTEDFAHGLASLMEYLTIQRKYSCIKWVCITNEPPGGTWGYWWSAGPEDASLIPAYKAVREALDELKINIPISGPDWTDLPPFDSSKLDFDNYLGAYDIHSYQGMDQQRQGVLAEWADWAHQRNKPLFLSEMGNMKLGWGTDNPGPKSFEAALSNAETVLRGLSVGVDAFNRWSFTNRGDMDGQWQLVRTWDIDRKRYLDSVSAEPIAFFGYGILTRFMAKNSSILGTQVEGDSAILSQAVLSPGGNITIFVLNRTEIDHAVVLVVEPPVEPTDLFLYRVGQKMALDGTFELNPTRLTKTPNQANGWEFISHSQSITTLSSFELSNSQSGVVIDF